MKNIFTWKSNYINVSLMAKRWLFAKSREYYFSVFLIMIHEIFLLILLSKWLKILYFWRNYWQENKIIVQHRIKIIIKFWGIFLKISNRLIITIFQNITFIIYNNINKNNITDFVDKT